MSITKQEYAREIGIIGQRMGEIGQKFGVISGRQVEGIEDIEQMKIDYQEVSDEFRELEIVFEKTEAPEGYHTEHSEMLQAYRDYVDATEGMSRGLSLEALESGEYKQYELKQQNASAELVKTTKVATKKMFGV